MTWTHRSVAACAALAFAALPASAQVDGALQADQVEPEAVLSIAVDSSNSRVVYAGTAGLGVVKSVDTGNSWFSTGPELSGLAIPTLAVHPATSQVVYAGTEGQGLWISTSAGLHFEEASVGLPSAFIRDIVVDPVHTRTVYAATSAGLARSDFAGQRWRALDGLVDVRTVVLGALSESEECTFRGFNGAESRPCRNVFAVADGGVWRSTNSGRRFSPLLNIVRMEQLAVESLSRQGRDLAGRPPSPTLGTVPTLGADERLIVRVAPEAALVYVGSSRLGLFRSRDGGQTWRHLRALEHGVLSLAVDPVTPQRIFVGTEAGVFVSTNAGQTVDAIEQGSELPIEVLEIDPQRPEFVYAAAPGGRVLIRRDDGGWSIRGLRDGQLTSGGDQVYSRSRFRLDRLPARPLAQRQLGPFANVQVHDITSDRRFPRVLYAATSRGVYRSDDAGRTWESRHRSLGEMPVRSLAVEPADSYARDPEEEATILAGTRGAGVYYSKNSGRSWRRSSEGLEDPDVRVVWLDEHDPDLALAGTAAAGVFRSEDGGRSWRGSSEGIEIQSVLDIASAGSEIYLGTSMGGVYRSPDLGRSWNRLEPIGVPSPASPWVDLLRFGVYALGLDVRSLAVNPEREGELLAATAFGLFKTEDGGRSWAWRGRFMNATDVAFRPDRPLEAVAATSRGVVRSVDGGNTWLFERDARPNDGRQGVPATLSVHLIDAGEASGTRLVGTDDGRFLRRRAEGEERSVELPVRGAVVDWSLQAQGYAEDAPVPRADALRLERDRFLIGLASASEDELLMEDVRLSALLALEAWLRGEDFFESAPGVNLEDGLLNVVRHWARLQRQFLDEAAPQTLEFDPTGRFLAAVHHFDNGSEQRSELQIFSLGNVLFYGEGSPTSLGPNRFWKELHAPYRRPEQMPPVFSSPEAGRFLGWGPSGMAVATAFGHDALMLWRLPEQSILASAVPRQLVPRQVDGFRAPVAAAAFAPSGRYLGALDRDGRPYSVVLANESGRARPLAAEPPEGGARQLAMLDAGLLSFGDGGQVRFWPLPGAPGGAEPELIREEGERFDHVDVDPTGRWVLAAVDAAEANPRERWKRILLVPHRLGRPGPVAVIGAGGYWSRALFSPDGRWLAISGREDTELWELSDEPQRFLGVAVGAPVRFSADSRRIQIGDELFSLDATSETRRARRGVDDALLASIRTLDRGELWRSFDLGEVHRRRELWPRGRIRHPSGRAQQVRASVDGRWMVATGAPWQLHYWYFGNDLGVLLPPTDLALVSSRRVHWVNSGPSPAVSWLEGRVEALQSEVGRSLFHGVCGVVGRSLTTQEWRRFFGEEPYRATCARPERSR
ncbi:MAG: hypothetical protein AAGM22_12295 [Acidobacteriota bacterium]